MDAPVSYSASQKEMAELGVAPIPDDLPLQSQCSDTRDASLRRVCCSLAVRCWCISLPNIWIRVSISPCPFQLGILVILTSCIFLSLRRSCEKGVGDGIGACSLWPCCWWLWNWDNLYENRSASLHPRLQMQSKNCSRQSLSLVTLLLPARQAHSIAQLSETIVHPKTSKGTFSLAECPVDEFPRALLSASVGKTSWTWQKPFFLWHIFLMAVLFCD